MNNDAGCCASASTAAAIIRASHEPGPVALALPTGRLLRWRLAALLFMVFAAPGAVLPQLTVYLTDGLGFTPAQVGLVCAMQALGALCAPFVAGQLADRWFAADRCLAGCAFCAAGLLWLLPHCTGPAAVVVASLALWLVMTPAMTLGSAISFTHLRRPEREFGGVRLWGTVGWLVQGWLLGYWFSRPQWLGSVAGWLRSKPPLPELADIFRLGSLMALLLGLYALTLPATPPAVRRAGMQPLRVRIAPVAALRLLRRRAFAVYFLCNFGLCVTLPFSSQNTPLLLLQLGVPQDWLGPALTIAQSTEVIALGLLPLMLGRWGHRRLMLAGALAWTAAMTVMTVGRPLGLVIGCLSLNGVFICCYLVAGQVFVNSEASSDIRASAQSLLTFTNGLGMLVGNLLSGWVRDWAGGAFAPTFGVAAAIALLTLLVFSAGFRHVPVPSRA